MNQVNCAVIGVGRLGAVHIENLIHNIPEATVKTIVTSNKGSAQRAAQRFHVNHCTHDVEEVFNDETIDAVVIAAPTNMHAALVKEAAKHNKHIFVDKPITETVEEADEVIQVLNNSSSICQVGFMRRFDPSYTDAKERIERGDIGEPIYFKGISRDPGSPPEQFIEASGGIFKDMNIHEYDIATYLMNSKVKSVQSFGKVLVHPFMHKYSDVDQTMTLLEFENGAIGDIEGSRNSAYGYEARGEVVGTEGIIHIGSNNVSRNVVMSHNKTYYENIMDFQTKFQEAFYLEINHFIDCVLKGKNPRVDQHDGRNSLAISEAALKSFKEDKKIFI